MIWHLFTQSYWCSNTLDWWDIFILRMRTGKGITLRRASTWKRNLARSHQQWDGRNCRCRVEWAVSLRIDCAHPHWLMYSNPNITVYSFNNIQTIYSKWATHFREEEKLTICCHFYSVYQSVVFSWLHFILLFTLKFNTFKTFLGGFLKSSKLDAYSKIQSTFCKITFKNFITNIGRSRKYFVLLAQIK